MFRSRANETAEGRDNNKNKDVNVPLVHTQDDKDYDPKNKSSNDKYDGSASEDDEQSEKAVQAQERKRRKRRIMKIAVYFMFGIISVGVFAIWLFHKDPVEFLRFGSDFIFTVKLRSLEIRNADGDSILYADLGRQLLASPYDHCWDDQYDDYEENCLYWRKAARLRVSQHSNSSSSSCYTMKWEGLKEGYEAEDCFYLQYYQWYGHLSRGTPSWPISGPRLHYVDYYTAYPRSQTDNLIPVWFGSQSVAIFVDSKFPFSVSWNVSEKKQFCIKSKNSAEENGKSTTLLEYTVCQGNSLPDIYNITHKHRLRVDSSSPFYSSSSFTHSISNPVDLYPEEPIYALSSNDCVSCVVKMISHNRSECGFLELFEGWEKEIGDLSINPNLTDRVIEVKAAADMHNCRATFPVSPFFSYRSQHFQQGVELGYFVQDSFKLATRMLIWRGLEGAALDVTNPNATKWFLSIVNKLITEYDVTAIKLLHLDIPLDSSFHDNNVTYLEYNQIFYRRLSSSLNVSLILEMASGFITSPVYTPVKMIFEGPPEQSCMISSIPDSLIMGLSGFPLLIAELDVESHDTAITHQMVTRWLQLAIFYPVLRIPYYIPVMKEDKIKNFLKGVLKLRTDVFLPYLKRVWKHQHNSPIIRPLWWSAASKKPVLGINDQFMVGDRLLVAPVLCEGMVSRSVYLPEGNWFREGENPVNVKGPQTVKVATDDLNVIPYFWKK